MNTLDAAPTHKLMILASLITVDPSQGVSAAIRGSVISDAATDAVFAGLGWREWVR